MTSDSLYKSAYEREKFARKKSESILNAKSLELYQLKELLEKENKELDLKVEERTEELKIINEELEQRVQDRTEELELALTFANESIQAKTEFLAIMSHEVRTPLNGIVGITELLKSYKLGERISEMTHMLDNSAKALLLVLNEMLDFAKLDAQKFELVNSQFELNDLINTVVETNQATAKASDIDFKIESEIEGSSYYVGDSLSLRQVLNNFVSNAMKFSPEGKVILRVNSELIGHDEHMLTFHVIDNGVGIETAKLDNIFSPFTQADSSITRKYGGTGLGLAICKQLVELMNGTYGVDSEANKGSHFWFKVPLTKLSLLPDTIKESEPTTAGKNDQFTANILIAEDNPVNQYVIKNLLESFGVLCVLVDNGQQAVDKAKNEPYDLIFMDYHMPVMDGIEATRLIRKQAGTGLNSKTPIIALTADIQLEVDKKFRLVGANGTMIKPITRIVLQQQLAYWLSKIENTRVELNSARNEAPILDSSALDDMFSLSAEHGKDIVRQVIELYHKSAPELIKDIHQAADDNDSVAMFEAAHSLKSSSANIGLVRLAEITKKIEAMCRDSQLDKTHSLLATLDDHYQEAKLALKVIN